MAEKGRPVPPTIEERLKRGRDRMRKDAALRNECLRFWRGDQFVHRDKNGYLVKQGTVRGEKPDHRVRRAYNLLIDVVRHEVSVATSRIPSYEVAPSTLDPEDISAARLAQKVALFGFDEWGIRDAIKQVVTYAVVADEGFAWPYFDNTIGPYISDDGIGVGDIRVRVFGPNEVGWEPGVRFENSRYHFVEQARPLDEVYQLPGYIGGELAPDATTSDVLGEGKRQDNHELVLVTEYLERPCPKYPDGRRLVIANGRQIVEEETYPLVGPEGVIDEPVLHKLAYIVDPDNDRDMGLVRHLLDPQRLYNNCWNREVEWMQAALAPQMLAPQGSLKTRLTDEPNKVIEFIPINGIIPKWRDVPSIPPELSRLKEQAQQTIGAIASQNQIPSQVEAGKAISALIERDETARGSFIADLAGFHSGFMRHCLMLVQRHFTENRLLKIRGRFGIEAIPDFRGADLRGQADIRVSPDSLEPRTKRAMEQRVQFYAQQGWIDPQKAISAIETGMAESLVDDISDDISWQNFEIQQMMGLPRGTGDVPIARSFDNHQVHLEQLHKWMKTPDFAMSAPEVQEAATLHEQQHQMALQEQQMQAQLAQSQMAEQLGEQNAAKPAAPKPMPDQAPPPDETSPTP